MEPQKLMNGRYKLNMMSDIYSVGVLLWVISSGIKPYREYSHDAALVIQISKEGLREKIVPNTPTYYSNLYTGNVNYS